MAACRVGPTEELAGCMAQCPDRPTRATLRWSCAGGEEGPVCEALACGPGARLELGRCVPNDEICNNGLDDDADGLIDGTLEGDDPCAATVDTRGSAHQFGWCETPGEEACEDRDRLGRLSTNAQCLGYDCPFMVELTYAYALDREEVSMRAYRQCVHAGCCAPPTGRLWRMVDSTLPQGVEPAPRPAAPERCMPPPAIAPLGVDPEAAGLPEGVIAADDPLVVDLPVSSVSWCQARAYCAWAGKRLPTEYEWERAAMGLGARRKYGWGESEPASCPELDCCRAPEFRVEGAPPPGCDPDRAEIPICQTDLPDETRGRCLSNYGAGAACADRDLDDTCPECLRSTTPVWGNEDGATPLGIKNLDGNVTEWVYDWHTWGHDYTRTDSRLDPVGQACSSSSQDVKALRGADRKSVV